jgi:hypothetical protein
MKCWPSSRARRARVAARRRVASWRALVTRQPRRANWQGRACATHTFGPRTSGELYAGPLASRAARDAAAARRDHGALLTRARRRRAWHVCLSRASTRVHVCRCEARRRAMTRWRRWHRARLSGLRAARRARDHGRGRLSGRCILVPSRDVSTILLVMTGRKTPGPDTGGAPRGRCAAWTYRRAPGVQTSLSTWWAAGRIWALSPIIFLSRPSAQCRRKREGEIQTSDVLKEGCDAWYFFGPKPTSVLGPGHWATHGPETFLTHFGLSAAGR